VKLKLATAMPSSVVAALEDLVKPFYSKPGMRILGIVELAHVDRLEVAPDEDKEPVVTAGIKMLEIAHGEQVEHLRKAARALHVQRTATGTLDEEVGALQLNKNLVEELADDFALRETARLRAAMQHQAGILHRLKIGTFSETDMRKQIAKLHGIVKAALEFREEDEDETDDE
jgi:hypothetical protein